MHFTRVNGINLAYYASGHGGPVLAMWGQPEKLARALLDFLD